MSGTETQLSVAIIDCGIDLQKLYNGERHGYNAVWVAVSDLSFESIVDCDIVIIPAGSDGTLLAAKSEHLRRYLRHGGWLFSFDGVADGVLDGVRWRHTPTNYKEQQFYVAKNDYSSLLESVELDGLLSKDGVKGWWCEGELVGDRLIPLIVDTEDRIIAGVVEYGFNGGRLVATAAARLPLFSNEPSLSPNVLFQNLLRSRTNHPNIAFERDAEKHLYLHAGNFAHRSFLASDEFGPDFTGIHWTCLDEEVACSMDSIWIPWESNAESLRRLWPMLEEAVSSGTTLVIEDLRGSWLPGVCWHARSVDSSWWREKRKLDLQIEPELTKLFPGASERTFFWHYHGVFDGTDSGTSLLKTSDGMNVLSLLEKPQWKGRILVSTLDATFEYGVGKIKETRDYIRALLRFIEEGPRDVLLTGESPADASS